MARKTIGSGQWTNMGNVTTNPDGSYSDSKTYNFLDMVSYNGGSYICLQDGINGVRPSDGESTDIWFCSSVPGEASPAFQNLAEEVKEAAKTAKEKATDAEASAKKSNDSAMAVSSAASLAIDAAKNAENSKDVVAGYKRAAEKAANDAASSKESVDTKIAGLDETFANKTNSSMQSINKAADAKAEEIKTEIDATKASMISESQKAINEATDAGKQEINTVGAEQITNIQKAAQAVTDASKQIEQNKKDVDSLKKDINYVTVEQFGAVGDGVTDDTQAFKDAVAKSIETGKTLKLSSKTYVVSIIAIKKPIIMQGCGESTVIKHIGTGNLYAVVNIEGDNDGTVVLRDFVIDANRNGDTSGNIRGLNITRRKGISVENITFKNGRNGAYIGYWDQTQHYPSDDVRFYKCKFEKNTMNELVIASGKNIKMIDCYFDSGACDSSLIDIEAHGDNASFDYVLLQNCYIKQNTGSKSVQCISNQYNNIKSYIIFDNCYIDSRIEVTRMDNVRFINCNIKDLIEIKSSKNNIMESCVCDRIYNYSRKRFSEENETKDNHIRNCIINNGIIMLLISQFVTNQIYSHVTDLLSFVSLAFLCNPADFLPDYLFHLQCYI